MTALLIVGGVFAAIAALIHIAIFAMESVLWTRPTVWQRFGIASQAEADTIRPMAFNQGFYNLFLALGAGIGLTLWGADATRPAGVALTAFALLSMLLAAVVLVSSRRSLWRAAILQGGAPLVGFALLLAALAVGV